MRPALSIVLPAYNEEGNIERGVRDAAAAAADLAPPYEIVVVDDGSRDRTGEILARLAAEMGARLRVVRHPVNEGYGAALRDGFRATTGELVFYTDSDNQFDLRELADILPLMKDVDAVLGYRVDRQDPWMRRAVSGGFNRLSSTALGHVGARPELLVQALPRATSSAPCPSTRPTSSWTPRWWRASTARAGATCSAACGTTRAPPGGRRCAPSDVPRTLVSLARMWLRLRGERPARKG